MQINLQGIGEFSWRVLSEIPGWPDAPLSARLRRIIPIAFPCVIALGLAGWSYGIREQQMTAMRVSQANLLALEAEVAELRMSWSEQTAGELAATAEHAAARLVHSSDEARESLQRLKTEIAAAGWEAAFQVYDPMSEADQVQELIQFTPAVARLESLPKTDAPFRGLLSVLEAFATFDKRIDVTRLAVRVDDRQRPKVELNLRIAAAFSDEKPAQ